jgi:hypothetical protein
MGHWLGETTYSVTGPSNFVAHDKATSIHKKAVETAKRKVANANSKRPSSEDLYLVKASEEMEALLALTPEERRKRIPHTEHPFENLTIQEVLHDMIERNFSVEDFENDISDDEGLDDMSDIVDDDEDEIMDDVAPTRIRILPSDDSTVDEEVVPKSKEEKMYTAKPATATTKKINLPKKRRIEEAGSVYNDKDDNNENDQFWKDSVKRKEIKSPAVHDSDSSEAEFRDEEIPSDDDKDDDDYCEADGDADHNTSIADLGVVEELGDLKSVKRKKSASKKTTGKSESNEAKASSKKSTIPLKERNDKQKREWMYLKFRTNQKKMVPLLERLYRISSETKTKEIYSLLSELDSLIETMCWVFIEVHKVPSLLKPAKKELKSRNKDISILSKLRNKMKERYEENKSDCNMAFSYTPVATSYLGGQVQTSTLNKKSDGFSRKRMSGARNASPQRDRDVKKSKPADGKDSGNKMPKPRHSTGSLLSLEQHARKEGTQGEKPQSVEMKRAESVDKQPPYPAPLSLSGSVEKDLGDGSTKVNTAGRKSPSKPKPKFSLAGLMKPSTQEKDKTTVTTAPPKIPQSSVVKVERELPAWLRNDSKRMDLTRNRLFGLEFYKEVVDNFPSEKVNRESVAVELENATFQWARETSEQDTTEADLAQKIEDLYWRKIRAIVTVVSGKHSSGSLLQDIVKGKFAEPRDLINLSDQDLLQQYFNT